MSLKPYDKLYDACAEAGLQLELGDSGAYGVGEKTIRCLVLEVVTTGDKKKIAHLAVQWPESIHQASQRFMDHLVEQKVLER